MSGNCLIDRLKSWHPRPHDRKIARTYRRQRYLHIEAVFVLVASRDHECAVLACADGGKM